uniref:Uncharacterized protein n=2 Tax=Bombyx mori TaxID=7091 RepID=A0A8R2R2Q1_BOMMO|nr:uncharacterized protein LOC119629224 [Bombyx mori]
MVDVFITLEMIISNKYNMAVYVVRYLEITLDFLMLFAPVLLADMMAVQVDGLKITLHDRLCLNNGVDMKRYSSLAEFIGYVEARGCRLRACRVVPLDLTLPVTVFNVCVTYLIVMIQFADLY